MNYDPASPDLSTASDGRVSLDATLLKSLRKTRGLSQEALAELCMARQLPVSIASIKRAETGKAVLYRTARHLATILDTDLDTLLDSAAAPSAPAAAPPPVAASAPHSDSVRYVIELHLLLGAPPSESARRDMLAACTRFGGALRQADTARPVAIFGLPQAFRSDAERALRCALALRKTLQVHGGRALALRLARSTNGVADAGPELPVPPAGADPLALPIHVARALTGQLDGHYRFEAEDAEWTRFAGAGAGEAQQALSGRVAELRQFQVLAETAQETGAARVIYLRAAAGVGKTRLGAEFAERARTLGFSCHRAHVHDAGADGWRAPLCELARSLFDAGGAADDELAQRIDSVMAALGLDPEAQIFYRALTGARMRSDQLSLYAAMSHAVREAGLGAALQALLQRRVAREPLLLAVEDVHWGESYLFDALGALMAATRDAPAIWVLSSRIEDDPLDTFLRPHLYELPLTVFDLAPLGQREAEALADQYLEVDPAQRQRCVERAQGNPLFLTQLLASPRHQLPDSLKHLIQARVDALPPLQQRALRTAAVIGNRFEPSVLAEALGVAEIEFDAAGRSALVRRVGPDAAVFVHDLVMHCIYESIEPDEQRRLHRAVAGLYRERDPAVSAQHLYRAADPAAFDMMLRAIRDKLAAHDYEVALELSDACSANDSTRLSSFTLALLKAQAIAGMGRMPQARQAYEQALMLAGRPQEKIDAVIGLATTLNILEELDEEERLLDDTLPLARSIDADASLARLLYLKGNIFFPRGNYAECRRHHEDAARYARASGASDTEARALSGVGDSFYAQGHMNQAHALFGQCIAMCERHGLVGIEASNRSALGSTRLYLGQPALALDDALHSALLARRVGNRRAEVFARMTAGWVLVATGELERAEAEVEQALAMARSIGAARFETFLLESQARISWQRGSQALAEQQIMAVAERVRTLQLERFIGPWVLGTVAVMSSDAGVRKRALLQGAAYLTRDCLAHNAFRFFLSAAEVALLDGDAVAADFYAGQLQAAAGDDPCVWTTHHADLIRSYAAHAQQPGAALRNRLRQLRAQGRQYGFAHAAPRLEEALSRL